MATTEQEKKQTAEYVPADTSGRNYDKENMSDEDFARTQELGKLWNEYSKAGNHSAAADVHKEVEKIRAKYNYSGGTDGSEYISTKPKAEAPATPTPAAPQSTAQAPDFTGLLSSWLQTSQAQQQAQIDYATNQGVKELQRAEEDAQEQFQTQQNQTDRDEAKALDNQALYAEARGDRGGIGEAQYAQIQATAMQNRRAINSARTKLATDTSRAIADLRAQGEFQKADALLQLTQTYLGQLIELQQWGAEYALDVEKFNIQLQQWQAEFGEDARRFDLEFGYATSQDEQAKLAESGLAALAVGVRPSAAQQAALGYTDAQINAELNAYRLAQAAGVKLTGDGDGDADEQDYDGLFEAALKSGTPQSFIANNYKKYGFTSNTGLYSDYKTWVDSPESEEPSPPDTEIPHYGTKFSTATEEVQRMFREGRSTQEIIDYIDTYSETELTDSAINYFLSKMGVAGYRG